MTTLTFSPYLCKLIREHKKICNKIKNVNLKTMIGFMAVASKTELVRKINFLITDDPNKAWTLYDLA